ncbi:MAG TPA: hypothetical protein PK257_01950 [Candidatus Woesebacteria bacterium]|nr:hypothetical protein [Candidatus Woesebacteria bacterium]
MIGNTKWFNIRKYSGWGLTPNCWQGWAYIFAFIIPVAFISNLNINPNLKNIFSIIIVAVLLIDTLHIMSQIKKDERERLHEAVADRNALWFLLFGLIIWAFIRQMVDPIFIGILLGATAIKAITQIYLRDK